MDEPLDPNGKRGATESLALTSNPCVSGRSDMSRAAKPGLIIDNTR